MAPDDTAIANERSDNLRGRYACQLGVMHIRSKVLRAFRVSFVAK